MHDSLPPLSSASLTYGIPDGGGSVMAPPSGIPQVSEGDMEQKPLPPATDV